MPEKGDSTLEESTPYRELWMPEDNPHLPSYVRLPRQEGQPRKHRTTRTLIAVPMVIRSVTTSLMYFESDELIHASDRAKEELERIARALTRLYTLYEHNQDTHKATGQEIDELAESSRSVQDWGVTLPSLFFAYPERSDPDVISELQSQLDDLEKRGLTRLFDWREFHEGGRITDKIEEEIGGPSTSSATCQRSKMMSPFAVSTTTPTSCMRRECSRVSPTMRPNALGTGY